jgi:multiple sugar transport system substrate-binding protein
MKRAALLGNPPTRRSVFLDPELLAKFRAFPVQLQSLESARPRPRTPRWNEIENAFGIYLSQANSGALAPDEAMRRAAKDIAGIVAR